MRHSILVLLLFILTGCGQPNPAGTGNTPAKPVLTQKEIDEKHAANFLEGAQDFRKEGQPKHAIKALKFVVDIYPESEAAKEAREILAELEKRATTDMQQKPGETMAVRGELQYYPQDVRSVEAWLGQEFMIGETPVRPTQKVPPEVLKTLVGENVEIEGQWNAGKEWTPPKPEEEAFQSQSLAYPEGAIIKIGSGIEASAITKVEK